MSESHPVDFKSYFRRCVYVFIAVVCTTAMMIYASFLPHFGWPAKVVMILAIACVNAFVVAGFLMHLLSEKKMIYTVLSFTVFFVAGLFALTIYAMHDFPTGTQMH
jgi:caa(3)-type oxidase subunit IV